MAAAEAVRGSAAALLFVGLKLRRAGARAALALMVIARTGTRALLLLLLKTFSGAGKTQAAAFERARA